MSGDRRTQVFAEDGPNHIGAGIEIDWGNEEHLRCITACLVRGTYIMESDRSRGEEDTPSALAPAWWESFHFRHRRDYKVELACECVWCRASQRFHGATSTRRWFIFGAVFEYAPPPDAAVANSQLAPRYIVAFRGTMLRDPTGPADMHDNFSILLSRQRSSDRFRHAREMVERLLQESAGSGGVWLAGHSLGASIALDVGCRMMINDGSSLPTFLFNPPHVSLAPAVGEEAKRDVYTVGIIGRYLMGKLVPQQKNHMEDRFRRLALWVPNVYVHPEDFICEGFIYDLEQREQMRQRHPWLAPYAILSCRDMISTSLFGRRSEQPHLLPSANLWINQSQQQDDGHGLRQWWQPRGSEELVLDPTPNIYRWSSK